MMLRQQHSSSNAAQVLYDVGKSQPECGAASMSTSFTTNSLKAVSVDASVSTMTSRHSIPEAWVGDTPCIQNAHTSPSHDAARELRSHAIARSSGSNVSRDNNVLEAARPFLTGDLSADRDILAFYAARQKILVGN